MEFEIEHIRFANQKLSVRVNGFTSPNLLVNGEVVSGKRGTFELTDDAGLPCTIKLKNGFPDPVPKVIVASDEPMSLVDPIPAYGWVLAALPLTLIFMGGALGGAMGGMASVGITFVMRSELPVWARVGLSLAFSMMAVVGYLVLVTVIMMLTS